MTALTPITGPFSPGMDQLVQLVNQLNAILAATTTNAGALTVTGNFAVGSNVFTVASASGNTALSGTLAVSGNTTLSGTLAVTGASTLTGNVTAQGTLTSTGAFTASSTAHIVGAATLDSTLAVTGNISCSAYKLDSTGNALSAAGTTRADALQLAKQRNILTTVASGTGVILPVGVIGMRITIFNAGANPVQVYASGSETIDTVAGATGVPLANAKRADFFFDAANTWISAQLGAISA